MKREELEEKGVDQMLSDLMEKFTDDEGNIKPMKSRTITLEMVEESMSVFPQENRIPDDYSFDQIHEICKTMGMETVILNSIIPYRNALTTLENRYLDMKAVMYAQGYTLLFDPFIPEYMGMKFHKDEKTGRNYYIKDDFYLANIENNDWYAFSQSFEPVKIVIENMLMGYHILRSLGMKIEIDEILNAE